MNYPIFWNFLSLFNCIFGLILIKKNIKRVYIYRVLTWQSEGTWHRADERTCDTGTRVCAYVRVRVCVTCICDTHVCAGQVCAELYIYYKHP